MLRDFPLELLQPLTGALPAMRGAMTKAAEQTQRGRSNNYLAPFAGACVWGGVWGGGHATITWPPFMVGGLVGEGEGVWSASQLSWCRPPGRCSLSSLVLSCLVIYSCVCVCAEGGVRSHQWAWPVGGRGEIGDDMVGRGGVG